MKPLVAIVVVSLLSLLNAGPPQAPSALDTRQETPFRVTNPQLAAPCYLATSLDQIARKANLLVGLENPRGCPRTAPRSRNAGPDGIDLQGATAREALNHLVQLMPDYEWRDVDGVVVVRPKEAWDDPENVLNLPADPFHLSNQELWDILDGAVLSVRPRFQPVQRTWRASGRPIDAPVSIAFRGGTFLEALNEVVRPHPAEWELFYRDPRDVHVFVHTREFSGGAVMTQFTLPTLSR